MIAGYVTYDEIKLITGFDDNFLRACIKEGIREHQISFGRGKLRLHTEVLYNLEEVERFISLWL